MAATERERPRATERVASSQSGPPSDPGSSDESGRSGGGKSSTVRAVEVLGLAFLFPIAVYAGFRLGGWLGDLVGVSSLGSVVGGVVGASAGFFELLRRLRIEKDG